jgi:superfamily I DNA/RNA helicase
MKAIYSWRGAIPENIYTLIRDYPAISKHYLTVNYRGSPAICTVANSVIKINNATLSHKMAKVKVIGELEVPQPGHILASALKMLEFDDVSAQP